MTAYLLFDMLKLAIMAVLVASIGMEIPLALFCVFVLTKSLAVLVFLIFRRVVSKISKVKAFFMKGLSIRLPVLSTVHAVIRVWFLKKTSANIRLPVLSTIYTVIRGWFLKENLATKLQRERKIEVLNRHLKLQEELRQYGSTSLQGMVNRLKLQRERKIEVLNRHLKLQEELRQYGSTSLQGMVNRLKLQRERKIEVLNRHLKFQEELQQYGSTSLQGMVNRLKLQRECKIEVLNRHLKLQGELRQYGSTSLQGMANRLKLQRGLREVAAKKIQNAFRNHVQAKKDAKEMETKMLELVQKMQALKL